MKSNLPKPLRLLSLALRTLAFAYCVILAALYIFQRDLLYHPYPDYTPPSTAGLTQFTEVPITTQDGITLTSWYAPATANNKTILYFHGNAGGLAYRVDTFDLLAKAGYGVFGLEYRGFSGNAGTPSEEGLYADARAAMNYLIKQQKISPKNIILMGRSLGSGIATQMATEYTVDSVFLLTPYDSIANVAQHTYPLFPVKFLVKDVFDSAARATNIQAPTYIFHGTQDQIIPIAHARTLFAALPEGNKQFIQLEGQNHSNIDLREILKKLQRRATASH